MNNILQKFYILKIWKKEGVLTGMSKVLCLFNNIGKLRI